MTCKQLAGACDVEFHANTFEEMAEMSKNHAMEMFKIGDQAHIEAMNEMRATMKSPEDMKEWFDYKRNQFNSLPDNK